MSFSAGVKAEMARVVAKKKCCQIAELAALMAMDGSIKESREGTPSLVMSNYNGAVARRAYKLSKSLLSSLTIQVAITKKPYLNKQNVYHVLIPYQPGFTEAVLPLGFEVDDSGWEILWHPFTFGDKCCQRAYLRGVFLGGGSVNNPEGNYHLEIITKDAVHSQIICRLMEGFSLTPRVSKRKQYYVIYLKESEQIVDFLNISGAHRALLEFENTRVLKGMRNQVNRLVNCETANLNKTVEAGVRQVETIRFLEKELGLEKLTPPLREIAKLRLEHPHVSLRELGQMADPVVGKSGVNHRLRKLETMAEELKAGR